MPQPSGRGTVSRFVGAAIAGLVAMLAGPSTAHAQDLPEIDRGTSVWVTTADGREHEGALESISPSGLVLGTDAKPESIAMSDVRRIEVRDPLWNGMRNGGIAGAVALTGFGVYLSLALCESPDGCLRYDLGPLAKAAGLGAGVGIAAGALIDLAIKGRRSVYSSSATVQVMPLLTTQSAGAQVILSWFP